MNCVMLLRRQGAEKLCQSLKVVNPNFPHSQIDISQRVSKKFSVTQFINGSKLIFFCSHFCLLHFSLIKFHLFHPSSLTFSQEERMARLADIDANRIDRQQRRRYQRKLQTENFLKSLHMLQANNYLRDSEDGSEAFEDYSIFMYRQNAPEFTDRVKELERKLLYPVRIVLS